MRKPSVREARDFKVRHLRTSAALREITTSVQRLRRTYRWPAVPAARKRCSPPSPAPVRSHITPARPLVPSAPTSPEQTSTKMRCALARVGRISRLRKTVSRVNRKQDDQPENYRV